MEIHPIEIPRLTVQAKRVAHNQLVRRATSDSTIMAYSVLRQDELDFFHNSALFINNYELGAMEEAKKFRHKPPSVEKFDPL